jgi:hypothetical protein
MGYENGLITDAPEVSLPGEGGEWKGEGGTIDPKHVEQAGKAGYALWREYQPIKWQDESGMQAVTQTQKTVVVPVKITKKPRGSWINTKYGTIQPGDVVVEVARGTASSTPNSYVMWGGISGWVRTGELKSVTVSPTYSRTNGGVDWVPSDYTGGGQEITPELTALLKKRRQDIETQTAQPAKKLPVLPIAAIGYFLLNR